MLALVDALQEGDIPHELHVEEVSTGDLVHRANEVVRISQ
jgi:hypothetical protein